MSDDTLLPGTDYIVKTKITDAPWEALPESDYTRFYYNDWVFKRNKRPRDPSFQFCPMPRRGKGERERNAALIMTYFHPFTLNPEHADGDVPFLGNLCMPGLTWHDSMLRWFDGRVACQETKRYLHNFMSVTRARPEEHEEEHSEDQLSDEELQVNKHNFRDALKTRMGSGPQKRDVTEDDVGEHDNVSKSTREAFDSAHAMWQIPTMHGSPELPEVSDISEGAVSYTHLTLPTKA